MININGISKLEADILLVVWGRGKVTNREVHETFLKKEIKDKKTGFIPYTTVMATMNGLVEKGILKVDRTRKTYIYSAILDRKELTKSIIQTVVKKIL